MATCARCGEELPTFSFGEEKKLCPSCRQMLATAPPGASFEPHSAPARQVAVYQFPVTVALLTINVLVFLAMVLQQRAALSHPDNLQLLNWGADFGPLSLGTQPWRILTSNYVHIGLPHLLVNMWALWQLGRATEHIFGRLLYLVIYTAAGISGSLLSLLHDPMGISAGASGALFGIIGALIAGLYLGKLPFPKQVRDGLLKNLVWVAVLTLGVGSFIARIDNAGHVGGLIMGLGLGAIIGPNLMEEPVPRAAYNRLVLIAAAFLLVGFWSLVKQKRGYVADLEKARLAMGGGHTDEVIRNLERAIARDPNDADALQLLAPAYLGKGDYAHAQTAYQRLVQFEPDNVTAKYMLGLIYGEQHKYEDARRVYSELTQQQPNHAGAWTMLGASLDGLNREEEAITAYNKAISLNPKSSETYRERGLAEAKLNRFQDAVASLQKAAELDPKNGEIQKDLADVYTVMGNTTAAAAAKRRAEELSPPSPQKPPSKQP